MRMGEKLRIMKVIGKIFLIYFAIVFCISAIEARCFSECVTFVTGVLLVLDSLPFIIKHIRKRRETSKEELSINSVLNMSHNLPEKEFINHYIQAEVNNRLGVGDRLIFKSVFKRSVIYTICYIVSNYILMESCYPQKNIVYNCLSALFIYLILLIRVDGVKILSRKAKKYPDESIYNLIDQELIEDASGWAYKRLITAGILLMSISVGVFVYSHKESQFFYKNVEGGVEITSFDPGVFGEKELVIPNELDGQTVIRISSRAFQGITSFESVVFPKELMYLGGEAFKNCSSLKSISIPEKVTEIRGNTFEGCTSLEKVALHDDIVDIHAYAFMGCKSLESIELPKHITEIHTYTFSGCKSLEKIDIPNGVTRIAARAFYDCDALYQVSIPNTVKEIGSSAFRDCQSLESIKLPGGVKVDERAFKESPTRVTYYFERDNKEDSDKVVEQKEKEELHEEPVKQEEDVSKENQELSVNDIAWKKEIFYEPIDRTKIKGKISNINGDFTEEEASKIIEELNKRIEAIDDDTDFYYIYSEEKGPEVIYTTIGEKAIFIADSEHIKEVFGDSVEYLKLNNWSEVVSVCRAAQNAGINIFVIGHYSEMASEKVGVPYFEMEFYY